MSERSSLAWTPGLEINAKVRKDGVAWPKAGDVHDRSTVLGKQTLILRVGHQGVPTRRRICLPVTPPFKRVSLPLSLEPSLSGRRSRRRLSSSFCSLSSLSVQSLFFLSCLKDEESRVRNTITKYHSDGGEEGKFVSAPWPQPSLGPKRWWVGSRGSLQRA